MRLNIRRVVGFVDHRIRSNKQILPVARGATVLAEVRLVGLACALETSALRVIGLEFKALAMFQHRRGCHLLGHWTASVPPIRT
jgi:hypothetical protein